MSEKKDDVKNDTQPEENELIMTEEETEESWFKKHKKKIFCGVGTVVAFVGGLFVLKNKDVIKSGLGSMGSMVNKDTAKAVADSIVQEVPKAKNIIPEGFKLTGNRLTPTALGNIMGCSAQEINKRIVNAGLAEKCINGEYAFTKLGEGLGEMMWKVSKAGHSFFNIEWDEAIIPLIFSAEEIAKRKEMQAKAAEIMADVYNKANK